MPAANRKARPTLGVLFILALGSGQTMAQSDPTSVRWSVQVRVGPALGGPLSGMEAKLREEGWSEESCDTRRLCRQSPYADRFVIHAEALLTRQLGSRAAIQAGISSGDLGSVSGTRNGVTVTAAWKLTTLSTLLHFVPVPRIHLGAGPMIGMLTRRTNPDQKPNPLRIGGALEGSLRSSDQGTQFLELVATYRWLPKVTEGPWPARQGNALFISGPSPLEANFSNLVIALGLGLRF